MSVSGYLKKSDRERGTRKNGGMTKQWKNMENTENMSHIETKDTKTQIVKASSRRHVDVTSENTQKPCSGAYMCFLEVQQKNQIKKVCLYFY